MRITKDTVWRLANYASELTGGTFRMQDPYNPGDGIRYVDGRDSTVGWNGRDAARRAAAYYFGVIDMAHPGQIGDRPEDIQAVGRFLVNWRESAVRAGAEDYNRHAAGARLGKR